MTFSPIDISGIAPEIALVTLAVAVLLAELLFTRNANILQGITGVGLLLAGGLAADLMNSSSSTFGGMVAVDGFTLFLKLILIGVTLLTVLISKDYFVDGSRAGKAFRIGEYFAVLLLTAVGMMALAAATDLVMLFIGLETMSIGLYILAGMRFDRARSTESALKYLLLGAFASAFLLYGIALLYGSTGGKTGFADIAFAIRSMGDSRPVILYAGAALVLVGLLFKVAAAPFHFWSPDVYQGAPTPVTAFMSAGPKAAAMAVTIRLFGWVLPDLASVWGPALWVIAAATMTVGNVIAISQKDIKRMLAYSSISHAGYLLLAVLAAGNEGVRSLAASGMLFYLLGYYLMNLGAFSVAIAVSRSRSNGDYQIDDYQGLASRQPYIALAMTVFMISLAGIPPTAGFWGKVFVFTAAVKAGYLGLVIVAVLNSVVSAFYYLRIVVNMYMKPAQGEATARLAPMAATAVFVCIAGIIGLGILPNGIRSIATRGAEQVNATPQVSASDTELTAKVQ